jgi:acetylornithine deacetylase
VTVALEQLLAALVACDSTNPGLVPGGAGEGPVAELIAAELARAGLEVEVSEVLPGRPNVVGRLRGTAAAGPTLMLCGHSDVVAAPAALFSPRVRDGRMFGRGTSDMKGGLAAALVAARRLSGDPPPGDVIVAALVDEEWRSAGAEALARTLQADAAIIVETTQLDLVVEHGGFAWFELESTGVEAAGDDTEHGRDAIAHLGAALSEVAALDRRLAAGPAASYGRPSVHVGTIAGGVQLSAWPGRAVAGVERCLTAHERPDDVRAEIAEVAVRARAGEPALELAVREVLMRPGIALDPGDPVVVALALAVSEVAGRAPLLRGDMGWMDSGIFAEAGIASVAFGPVGGGEHTEDEWVDLASVEACADVLVAAAGAFGGSRRAG